MITPKFKGKIEKGKIVFEDRDMFHMWLCYLEGKKVDIVVSKSSKSKTIPQLGYYFGVVVKIIAQETGDDSDSTHLFLKSMFLKEYKIVNNKRYTVISSVSKLTTVRMKEYIERVRIWAAKELGLNIPDPTKVNIEGGGII